MSIKDMPTWTWWALSWIMLNWPSIPCFTKQETNDHVSYHLSCDWSPYQKQAKLHLITHNLLFPFVSFHLDRGILWTQMWSHRQATTSATKPSSRLCRPHTKTTCQASVVLFSSLDCPPSDLPYGNLRYLIPTCLCNVRIVFMCIVCKLTMKQSECILITLVDCGMRSVYRFNKKANLMIFHIMSKSRLKFVYCCVGRLWEQSSSSKRQQCK